MEIITLKVISLIAIFAIAIIGGLIPLISAKLGNSERFFSLGNAFAGGLFLGVGFIHLLPEGIQVLSAYSEFPWGSVAATVGFAVLLLLDRILFPEHKNAKTLQGAGSETIYPYVLLAMLSIHSIVAGIALGLEEQIAGSVAMLVGILFHKGPAAFALIVSAHSAGVARARQKSILAFFSVMTPLGIIFGIGSGVVFSSANDLHGIMQGAFNAFAAGTFIYIAVIDIIDKELRTHQLQTARYVVSAVVGEDDVPKPAHADDRYSKFVLIIVGIVLVAFISDWKHSPHEGYGDSHDHAEQSSSWHESHGHGMAHHEHEGTDGHVCPDDHSGHEKHAVHHTDAEPGHHIHIDGHECLDHDGSHDEATEYKQEEHLESD